MSAPTILAQQLRLIGKTFLCWQRDYAAQIRVSLESKRWRLFAIFLAIVSTVGIASTTVLMTPLQQQKIERGPEWVKLSIPTPDLTEAIAHLSSAGDITPHNRFVRNGETLNSLFAAMGIRDSFAKHYLSGHQDTLPLLAPQKGQFIGAGVYPDGRLAYLRFYMEGPHAQDNRTIEVTRQGADLFTTILPFTFDTQEEAVSGVFKKTLSATAKSMQMPESVMEQLKDVWDGELNPVRDLKNGDLLRVIYEKKYADGTFVREGKLLAAQIVTHKGKTYEAFWFNDGSEAGNYYSLDGKSSRQTFLRVPLDIKDVSSEFAPLRRHPITGELRAHNGTDLRAPTGSKIFAASDGTITFVGYEAKGYGRYIKIDHGLGRKTVYAHMSRIAPGMKKGLRVEKGQVIGYVGMTGLATGPHLHYELVIDGVQINPRTADLPDTENLSAFRLAQLKAYAEPLQARFTLIAESDEESPEKVANSVAVSTPLTSPRS